MAIGAYFIVAVPFDPIINFYFASKTVLTRGVMEIGIVHKKTNIVRKIKGPMRRVAQLMGPGQSAK